MAYEQHTPGGLRELTKQLTIADVDAHFYARPGSHSRLTIGQILEEYDTGRLKASDAAEMLCALPRERPKPPPLTATEFRQNVNALRNGLRQCIERLIHDETLRPIPAPTSATNDVLDSASARISLALLRMLMNESQLEIETVGPYASRHIGSDGKVEVAVDNMSKDERIGLMLGAALRCDSLFARKQTSGLSRSWMNCMTFEKPHRES